MCHTFLIEIFIKESQNKIFLRNDYIFNVIKLTERDINKRGLTSVKFAFSFKRDLNKLYSK